MREKYYILENETYKFLWFVVPKCGSRSIRNHFKNLGEKLSVEKFRQFNESNSLNHFKFTFVRNPWDRLVSTWRDKINFEGRDLKYVNGYYKPYINCEFGEFIKLVRDDKIKATYEGNVVERHVQQQIKLIPIDKVDFIGRIEKFQVDFDNICDRLHIPRQKLPRKNTSAWRDGNKHYTEYYDDETRQIVAEKFARDIEHFGYEYGE